MLKRLGMIAAIVLSVGFALAGQALANDPGHTTPGFAPHGVKIVGTRGVGKTVSWTVRNWTYRGEPVQRDYDGQTQWTCEVFVSGRENHVGNRCSVKAKSAWRGRKLIFVVFGNYTPGCGSNYHGGTSSGSGCPETVYYHERFTDKIKIK